MHPTLLMCKYIAQTFDKANWHFSNIAYCYTSKNVPSRKSIKSCCAHWRTVLLWTTTPCPGKIYLLFFSLWKIPNLHFKIYVQTLSSITICSKLNWVLSLWLWNQIFSAKFLSVFWIELNQLNNEQVPNISLKGTCIVVCFTKEPNFTYWVCSE